MQEGSNGGVQANIQQINTPGYPKEVYQEDALVEVESSNVDLVGEIPEIVVTKAGFSANLKTVSTQNQVLGALLDILG